MTGVLQAEPASVAVTVRPCGRMMLGVTGDLATWSWAAGGDQALFVLGDGHDSRGGGPWRAESRLIFVAAATYVDLERAGAHRIVAVTRPLRGGGTKVWELLQLQGFCDVLLFDVGTGEIGHWIARTVAEGDAAEALDRLREDFDAGT